MEDFLRLLESKMIPYGGREYEEDIAVCKEMDDRELPEGRSQTDTESNEPYIFMGTALIQTKIFNLIDDDHLVNHMVKKYLGNLGLDKLVITVNNFNNS